MPIRLDRERRQTRAAGRTDKTSIDLLEHVRGGVQVEPLAEMRLRKDFNIESLEWCKPESKDVNGNPATSPHRSRLRRR
jgi:hypothetical protein